MRLFAIYWLVRDSQWATMGEKFNISLIITTRIAWPNKPRRLVPKKLDDLQDEPLGFSMRDFGADRRYVSIFPFFSCC